MIAPAFNEEKRPRLFLAYSRDGSGPQIHQRKIRQQTFAFADPKRKEAKPTILLIEDQAGFRLVFRDALEAEGYVVLEAGDGQSGWEKVKEHQPDLVLLDLMLPKLHGFKVLQNIRADRETSHIPVILLSILDDKGSEEKGKELGANGYVVKNRSPIETILNRIEPYFKSGE